MTLTMWDLLKSGWLCFFSSLTDWIRQAGAGAAERKVAFLAASEVVQVCVCFCVHNFACLPFYDCEHKKLQRLQKLACRGRV